jgi:hypothetical protein
MTQTEIEKIIKQRIKLCDTEVAPLLEKKDEELTNITITPKRFKEYIEAIGQKTMQLADEIEEPTLSVYDRYCGRVHGFQMVHKLLNLMKAPKVPFICDDGDTEYEDYKCGYCGHRIYEDDKFCSECGVALYFEEEMVGRR